MNGLSVIMQNDEPPVSTHCVCVCAFDREILSPVLIVECASIQSIFLLLLQIWIQIMCAVLKRENCLLSTLPFWTSLGRLHFSTVPTAHLTETVGPRCGFSGVKLEIDHRF